MVFHPGEPFSAASAGSTKTWVLDVAPWAMSVTVAPLASGLPTITSPLAGSLPTTTAVRSAGTTPGAGSLTTKDRPSTSLVGVHVDGAPVQAYPGSTVHVEEHPSPLVVFPSSHPSVGFTMPSPHTALHDDGSPMHVQPGST